MIHRTLILTLSLLLASPFLHSCKPEEEVEFDVRAGAASETLKLFSVQAEINILFSENDLQGIETQRVSGKMTAEAALEKMISNTGLIFHHDKDSQAIAVYYPSRN